MEYLSQDIMNRRIQSTSSFLGKFFRREKFRWHPVYSIFVLGGLTMLVALIPIWSGFRFDYLNGSTLDSSLNTVEFKCASVALLVSSIPLLVDMIIDCIFSYSSTNELGDSYFAYYITRNIVSISSFIVGLQFSLFSSNNWDPGILISNLSASFLFSVWCLRISFVCCFLVALSLCKPKLFPITHTFSIALLLGIISILRLYASGMHNQFDNITLLVAVVVLLVIIIFIACGVRNIFRSNTNAWVIEDYTVLLYLLLLLVGVVTSAIPEIILPISALGSSDVSNSTPSIVAATVYPFVAKIILIAVFPGRIARMDTLALKNHIISSKTAYIRFISHEMRTPMSTVFMGIKLSMRQLSDIIEPDTWVTEHLQTLTEVYAACGAALDILNELLLYDKLDFGLLDLKKQDVAVQDLIYDSAKMFSVQLREKNISFTIEGFANLENTEDAPSLIHLTDVIAVDKNKIKQVIRNVISNAIKFTPETGSIKLTVTFQPSLASIDTHSRITTMQTHMSVNTNDVVHSSARSIDCSNSPKSTRQTSFGIELSPRCDKMLLGYLVIDCTDTGAGISVDNQARLFKDIVQFSPEVLQNGGGSGLGMWLSKSIVDLHEGTISVYSEGEGKGSTFTLTLPMVRHIPILPASSYMLSPRIIVGASRRNSSETSLNHLINKSHGRTLSIESVGNTNLFNLSSKSLQNNHVSIASSKTMDDDHHNCQTLSSKSLDCNFKYTERLTENELTSMPKLSLAALDKSKVVNLSSKSIAESQCPNPSSAVTGRALFLLVVDDSKLNRKMLCKVLTSHGHRFEEAEHGLEAVEKVQSTLSETKSGDNTIPNSYDAILMDFVMPKMDGPTATAAIRKLGYQKPIIGVTGNALQQDKDTFLAAGVNEVLIKPVDSDLLQNVIMAMVERVDYDIHENLPKISTMYS